MYTKESILKGTRTNLSNYIEGIDIYNSAFLHYLSSPELEKVPYRITVYEYRPDMIAQDFYGSTEYLGILLAQLGVGLSYLKKGEVIYLIPKTVIDTLIRNI